MFLMNIREGKSNWIYKGEGMKETGFIRTLALLLFVLLCLRTSICAYATSTGQQLQNAQNEKNVAEKKLNQTNEAIDSLRDEEVSLQTYLTNLNDELDRANTKLMEIQRIKDEKEAAIEDAREQIAEAKKQQRVRYEEMKRRIKFMYEQGNQSYLQLFLAAESFADFLNKADYFEMMTRYDRLMLEEYARAEKEITQKENNLQSDTETLKVLEQEADSNSEAVYAIMQETGKNLKKYSEAIAKKEEQALAYEREMLEKEGDIAALQKKYKEELAISMRSAQMTNRDLSDVVYAAGDLDLMAAIIECEAGGESYTGKVAVGAVVLNRVRSPLFPNTVLEVIMQNRQFSPVGSGRFSIVLARGANESCYQAARDAMAGASPVGGCLFFRTPIPGLTGQQIGGHIFY